MEKTQNDVSLSDFSDYLLKDELLSRGYQIFNEDEDFLDHVSDYDLENEFQYRGLSTRLHDFDTNDLLDELEDRGFVSYERSSNTYGCDVDQIVQYHRCNDPRWEKLALEMIYDLANKVV